jgi:hypothetical protein
MSVLIDLVGASTSTDISGFLIHMVANTKDGSIPHTTDFHFHFWVGDKSQLSITHIGHLIDSKYLHGGTVQSNYKSSV